MCQILVRHLLVEGGLVPLCSQELADCRIDSPPLRGEAASWTEGVVDQMKYPFLLQYEENIPIQVEKSGFKYTMAQ
jgi:hypothetical protein